MLSVTTTESFGQSYWSLVWQILFLAPKKNYVAVNIGCKITIHGQFLMQLASLAGVNVTIWLSTVRYNTALTVSHLATT